MKLFGFTIEKENVERRTSNVERRPALALPDAEIRAAFAVPDTQPQWRAMLQLIAELENTANAQAQKAVANHGICASCNGGAEWLGLLRARLLQERAAGLQSGQSGSEA